MQKCNQNSLSTRNGISGAPTAKIGGGNISEKFEVSDGILKKNAMAAIFQKNIFRENFPECQSRAAARTGGLPRPTASGRRVLAAENLSKFSKY